MLLSTIYLCLGFDTPATFITHSTGIKLMLITESPIQETQRGSLSPMHLSPTLKYVSSIAIMHAYRGFRIKSSRTPTTVPSPSGVWPICVGIFLPGGRHRAASSIISGPLIKSGARQIAKFNGVIRVSEANCDTSCNVDITWRSMRRVDDDNPGRRISLILIISSRLTDYTD